METWEAEARQFIDAQKHLSSGPLNGCNHLRPSIELGKFLGRKVTADDDVCKTIQRVRWWTHWRQKCRKGFLTSQQPGHVASVGTDTYWQAFVADTKCEPQYLPVLRHAATKDREYTPPFVFLGTKISDFDPAAVPNG